MGLASKATDRIVSRFDALIDKGDQVEKTQRVVGYMSGDKVYDIKNQNFAALVANAGASVQLTGDVATDGKTITVTKIAPAGK